MTALGVGAVGEKGRAFGQMGALLAKARTPNRRIEELKGARGDTRPPRDYEKEANGLRVACFHVMTLG